LFVGAGRDLVDMAELFGINGAGSVAVLTRKEKRRSPFPVFIAGRVDAARTEEL